MKHTLFVAEDDFGCLDFEQTLETVVADEHTAIKVVQVGSGETTTIEWHEWTQLGRSDGDDFHNHPLGFVAIFGCAEGFYNLKTLESIVLFGYRTIIVGAVAKFIRKTIEVDALQEVENGFCTHLCNELVGIGIFEILIVAGEL